MTGKTKSQPRADAVEWLRNEAKSFAPATRGYGTREKLFDIADMVERDYVRRDTLRRPAPSEELERVTFQRDDWESKAIEWFKTAQESLTNCDEQRSRIRELEGLYASAKVERDELKASVVRQADAIGEWELRCERLESDCDEWKAKAEAADSGAKRGMTNLEWLYDATKYDGDAFHNFVIGLARPYYLEAHPEMEESAIITHRVGAWLLSEHVDQSQVSSPNETASGRESCGQDADRPGQPKSSAGESYLGTPEPERSQVPDHDTREKLEADVCKWIANSHAVFPKSREREFFGWLDRQADITASECAEDAEYYAGRFDAAVKKNAELQAKADELASVQDIQAARIMALEAGDETPACRKCFDSLRQDYYTAKKQRDDANCEKHNLQSTVRRLEGCLDGARKSRDHWLRVVGRNGEEIGKLMRQVEDAKEYGSIWPHFEDGAKVRFGDSYLNAKGNAGQVGFVGFRVMRGELCYRIGKGDSSLPWKPVSEPLKRPPLKAKDGLPIEVGQVGR